MKVKHMVQISLRMTIFDDETIWVTVEHQDSERQSRDLRRWRGEGSYPEEDIEPTLAALAGAAETALRRFQKAAGRLF